MSFPRFSAFSFVRLALVAGLGMLLAACAQRPVLQAAPAAEPAIKQGELEQLAPEDAGALTPAPAPQPELPNQELSEAVLYEYLLAEIAGQRGSIGLSAQAYADMAKRTRD